MTENYYQQAMGMISTYFAKPYRSDNIKAIWPEVKDMPEQAMNLAYKRVQQEFHHAALIPINRIKEIILQEGKRILTKQAEDREREAAEKKAQERGLNEVQPISSYDRECLKVVRAQMSDLEPQEKLKLIAALDKKYPNRGWKEVFMDVFKQMHKHGLIKADEAA